jgi:Pyruvate/2-oxoacid:ferredoxin oxidoreductase delta subunit
MIEENTSIKQVQVPVIDYTLCIKCKKCILVCPIDVISDPVNFTCGKCVKYCIAMEVPCSPDQFVFNYEACDSCGKCLEHCPEDAIYWHKVTK